MSEKLALVLTGGGARAAYQVGVVRAIFEIQQSHGLPHFDIFCGTSAGAINTSFLAGEAHDQNHSTRSLAEFWTGLDPQMIFKTDPVKLSTIGARWISGLMFGGASVTGNAANYLLDTSPLKRLIEKKFNQEQLRKNLESGIVQGISVSTTNYYSGANVVFLQGHGEVKEWSRTNRIGIEKTITAAHVLASAAIPIFFPPVFLEGSYYGDGSIRQLAPLGPAIRLGARKILCVGVRHARDAETTKELTVEAHRKSPHLAQIAGGMLNSVFLDSINYDIERMQRINEIMANVPHEMQTHKEQKARYVDVTLLLPSKDIGAMAGSYLNEFPPLIKFLLKGIGVTENDGTDLLSYLAFDRSYTSPLVNLGYEDTMGQKEKLIQFLSGKSA